jgi:hypothetical protein
MLTRDFYIAILEKRAAEEAPNDSQETALKEYADNAKDNRAYLSGIFDNTGAAEKASSREASKLFPGKSEKESGYMFMKVARALFNDALAQAETSGLMKTASAAYREVAFHSFCEELAKIAEQLSPTGLAAHAQLKDTAYKASLAGGAKPAPVQAAHNLASGEILGTQQRLMRVPRPSTMATGSVVSKLPTAAAHRL